MSQLMIMNMAFLRSLQTCQILFYLTVICNLATCSFSASKVDEEIRLESGCRYTYPSYISPYTPLTRIDLISCRNMLINELPFYENVTTMELINVPLIMLNDTEIPNAIQSSRVDLRRLYWTKSHIKIIKSLPVKNLIELDLSWNLIQEIYTNSFKDLINLEHLNISHNNIELLPENFFFEYNILRVLSLAHNQLKMIPHNTFFYLTHLETLDLSNNNIKYLKETLFHRNHHLDHLNLSYNRLSLIPSKLFESLSSLKFLSLEANQLFNIEPNTFITQHQLTILNLGKNPLLSLPILLPHNNTLFILTISHTKIVKLKATVLQNLHTLHNLYLTDNYHLQNLHNDTFINSKELKVIHLQNNNFTQLPHSILNTQPNDLLLDGNPWPCDCSIQWIIFWSYNNNNNRDNLRLTSYCNSTNRDLIEVLRKLHCKPKILHISPVHYELLEANVKLECKTYVYPTPIISWQTPSGKVFIKFSSEDKSINSNKEETTSEMQHLQSRITNWKKQMEHQEISNDNDNIYIQENGDLHIKHMSRDDAGEYICIVANTIGESFAYTKLYIDPSIMQKIKTGSIICGLLWVNTFLLFSIIYILIRRYSRRTKQEKQKQRMHENMDIYKSQQITRLRDRCKNQMNRIKNNCSLQVEWMKDNYIESMKNLQDHRASYLTNQYNEQMTEICEYYLIQMHKVREHFDQQSKLIMEFSINRVHNNNELLSEISSSSVNNDLVVRMENGGTAATLTAAGSIVTHINEDEIYHYNENMKSEIRKLTSLHNLYDAFAANKFTESAKLGVKGPNNSSDQSEIPEATFTSQIATNTSSKYNLHVVNNVSNGKLKISEDESDEKTSMLNKFKASR